MLKNLFGVVLLSIGSFCSGMDIVQNGNAAAVIVIDTNAPVMVEFAAEEFQDYIRKATGTTLAIVTTKSSTMNNVFIGESSYTTSAGIDVSALSWDSFKVKTIDDDLYLVGRDYGGADIVGMTSPFQAIHVINTNGDLHLNRFGETGTLYAVYHFLRENCGIGWYMPGEIGEVVPETANIAAASIDIQKSPDFEYRYLYHCKFNESDEQALWYRRAGYGAPYPVQIVHSFSLIITPNNIANHPEYFAWERDSNDNLVKDYTNLCLSNEDLLNDWVDIINAYFTAHPEQYIYPVMPNDHMATICECVACQAQIDPTMGEEGKFSNYVWGFVNKVATEVAKTHPNKLIGCCSYSNYTLPPENLTLSPNVAVSITKYRSDYWDPALKTKDRDVIDDWLAVTDNIYIWEYYNWTELRPHLRNLPILFSNYISEDLQYLNGKSKGEFIEAIGPAPDYLMSCPPLTHLNLYLTGRLLWDTTLDVDDLLSDYYTNFYGPASEEMESFWSLGELIWTTSPANRGVEIYYTLFTKDIVDELHSCLLAAIDQTQAGSVYRQRIQLILDEFEPVLDKVDCQISDEPSYTGILKGWEYNADDVYWGYWGSGGITNREIADGVLKGDFTANYGDPQIPYYCPTPIDSSEIKYLKIRMKIDTVDTKAQFFFNVGITGRNLTIEFDITGDGEFHEYLLPLYNLPNWQNVREIENVRIDPAKDGRINDHFEVDYIRLAGADTISTIKGWEFNGEEPAGPPWGMWTGGIAYDGITNYEIADGVLKGDFTANYGDPKIGCYPSTALDSSDLEYVKIGMKIKTVDTQAQFFFNVGITGRNSSATFDITGDGEFHEYTIPLCNLTNWDNVGNIENLRIDPAKDGRINDHFEIDYIRLAGSDSIFTIYGWDFETEQQTESLDGWLLYSSSIINKAITGGVLKRDITGNYSDPQIIFYCPNYIDSSKTDYMKIRMKIATTDTQSQFFFNLGITGRNASVTYDITGDGAFHEYTIPLYNLTNWENVGDIENVRIDPAKDGRLNDHFEIDFIRLLRIDSVNTVDGCEFNTSAEEAATYWSSDITNKDVSDGVLKGDITGSDPQVAYLITPNVDSSKVKYVKIRMKVNAKDTRSLFIINVGKANTASVLFDIISDNEFHEYTIPLYNAAGWENVGYIEDVRIDPVQIHDQVLEESFEIDYIRLMSKIN